MKCWFRFKEFLWEKFLLETYEEKAKEDLAALAEVAQRKEEFNKYWDELWELSGEEKNENT